MPSENVETLLAAYRFLRDVEHRLQYWDDQQTQTLSTSPEQQQLLAESMGFDSYAAFQTASMFIGTKSISCLTKS